MKKVHKIRVDSLEASTKFEGKWVAMLAREEEQESNRYWMSHKQMTSIHKNLDRPGTLYAAFDYSGPKGPRFIWASTDLAWLSDAFLKTDTAVKAAQVITQLKPAPEISGREWSEEDLPF